MSSHPRSLWLATVLPILMSASTLWGQQPAGSLDSTFATGGKLAPLSSYSLKAKDLLIGSENSLYVVSTSTRESPPPNTSANRSTLAKLTPGGALDLSYSSDGMVNPGFTNTETYGRAIAQQSNGKVLIGSQKSTGLIVNRITLAGAIDSPFGISNYAEASAGSSPILNDMAVQSDDKILLLGSAYHSWQIRKLVLVRLNANGSQDMTFGTYGVVDLANETASRTGLSLEVLPSGKIMVAGTSETTTVSVMLARFNSDGTLDASYATEGIGLSEALPVTSIGAIKTNASGEAFAVGTTVEGDIALMRFTAEGKLDRKFSQDGIVVTSVGTTSDSPVGVQQRSDGRIFVASTVTSGSTTDWCLLRYRPDGELDTSFDSDGIVTTSMGVGGDEARGLQIQPDGKVVVFGHALHSVASTTTAHGMARYIAGPLVTNEEPQISQPPTAVTVPLGQPASLTVSAATNTLIPWYVWRRNGDIVPGQHGPSLAIASAQISDQGSYTVEVGNYAGSVTSAAVQLRVIAPPIVVSSPTPVEGYRDTVRDFVVTVSGHVPFTYQWKKDDVNVGAPRISSELTDTLSVPVSDDTAGVYKVIITNVDGSDTSEVASLTVLPDTLVILNPPVAVDVVATSAAALSIKVGGRPPYTFQWLRGDQNYGSPIQQTSDTNTLVLPTATASSYVFRCVVTSAHGNATSDPVVATVRRNPTVLQKTPRLLLSAGSPLTLETTLYSAKPPSRFEWQLNTRKVVGATASTLHLPSAALINAGSYRLLMYTPGGNATSDNANVAVVESAQRTVVGAEGKTVTLTALTVGDGLSYAWRRQDGQPLTLPRHRGQTSKTLTISQCSAATDAAQYICDVNRSGVAGPTVSTGLISLVIVSEKPQLGAIAFPSGAIGRVYNYELNATNSPTKFTVSGLPSGLSYTPATGQVSGIPTKPGTFKVKVTAANPVGASVAGTYTIVIAPLARSVVGSFVGRIVDDEVESGRGTFTLTISESGAYSGRCSFINNGRLVAVSYAGILKEQTDGSLSGTSKPFSMASFYRLKNVPATITLDWSNSTALRGHMDVDMSFEPESEWPSMTWTMDPRRNLWNSKSNPATAYVGYHTMELAQPANTNEDSIGSGYASFHVTSGGTFTFAGKLPDGTAFAMPTFLEQDGSAWLNVWLYSYRGMLVGDLALSTGTAPDYRHGT